MEEGEREWERERERDRKGERGGGGMDHTSLLAQNSSALITPPTTSSRYSWCRLGVLFSMSDLACRLGSGGTWGGEAGRGREREGVRQGEGG